MTKKLITLKVNGEAHEIAVPSNRLLLEALREDLGLTGAKRGCDDSSCGSCAVLVDGVPLLSCCALAASYQDCEILTVEGIGEPGALHPIQSSYGESGGSQCGFCTPGFMISIKALLDRNPNPSHEEIRDALSGNLCRCTGYMQIYDSVKNAVLKIQARGAQESALTEVAR